MNLSSPIRRSGVGVAAVLALLAGCASGPARAPADAQPGIPAVLPLGSLPDSGQPGTLADWHALATDPALQRLAELALANNRDLRVALLNVERAQAALAGSEANKLPAIGVGVGAQRAPNTQGKQVNTFTAGVQLASWELDLFGRLRQLDDAARASLLATRAGQRAAELALVSQVLATGLTLRHDDAQLTLARRTLATRDETLRLTVLREKVGAASMLELQAQQALVAQARATLAQWQRQRAQDENALVLLVGAPVPADLLAAPAGSSPLAEVPVGLPSAVLLQRPDVVQAEQQLLAARANLGAARAALWPSITLTGQAGQASAQLSGLFEGGHFAYTLAANAVLSIYDGGRRQSAIAQADAAERIALAQYERAVQSAFRETADALVALSTWREQLAALAQQRDAARETARLTDLKAAQGAASVLEQLEAQRSLYAAEQAWLQAGLAEQTSRVTLYKALGR
ncbi:efflux transporter outer membrane subunit [Ideonella sp. DXS22W]|uniref:Efflux transporter outer membrane subunit n=1 Tax=Pseudaquabacterium inlustre TaxID=2984192 RepID=A0ABU9CCS4_9BURK